MDRVKPLKITDSGGAAEPYPQDLDKNEDAPDVRGVVIQNDTSDDDAVVVSRDVSNNLTFKDGVVSGTKTLTDLLEGEDDDQVKDNVPDGETFTVKENFQHIIYKSFRIAGEYIVRGTSAIIGGDDGGGGAPSAHASTHENSGSDEISVTGLSGELADDQPPKAHALGGSKHTSATLAQLNALVSDATLDDTSDARTPSSHAASHENGGADEIDVTGLSGELADDQPPKDHASSHQNGGGDAIKLDDLATPDDNTDLDVTTSAHGLCPKLGGGTTNFLRADGSWAAPSGGGTTLEVFSGYDNSGGTTVGGTWIDVPLNAEIKKTSGFTHSTSVNPAEVTVDEAGTYSIFAQVTVDQTASADRSDVLMRLMIDTGSGFTEIDGTRAAIYSRNTDQGKGTAAVSIARDLSAEDIVKVQAQLNSGSATIQLYADGSRLTIQKVKEASASGDAETLDGEDGSYYLDHRNFTNLHPINAQTGTTYTLQDSDNGKLVTLDNASAITLTVPSGLSSDFACALLQKGAGNVTISAGSGVTVNNIDNNTTTEGQWALASVTHIGSNVFFTQGRLSS